MFWNQVPLILWVFCRGFLWLWQYSGAPSKLRSTVLSSGAPIELRGTSNIISEARFWLRGTFPTHGYLRIPFFAKFDSIKARKKRKFLKPFLSLIIELVDQNPQDEMDSDTLLCNECGKCFKEEASLLVHYSKTHDKRSFTCGKCGDEIVGKQNQLNHMRKHKKCHSKTEKGAEVW